MDDPTSQSKAQSRTAAVLEQGYASDAQVPTAPSPGLKDSDSRAPEKDLKSEASADEKDVGATVESGGGAADLVAKEDFSVFMVPQKRAIVAAGSFIAWFSPMTGAIYYPALDQVGVLQHILRYIN